MRRSRTTEDSVRGRPIAMATYFLLLIRDPTVVVPFFGLGLAGASWSFVMSWGLFLFFDPWDSRFVSCGPNIYNKLPLCSIMFVKIYAIKIGRGCIDYSLTLRKRRCSV